MSKYREPSESYDVSADDISILEDLLETKKLTDKQKQALRNLLKKYYSLD